MSRYDVAGRLVAQLWADGAALIHAGMSESDIDAVWAQYATRYAYDGELLASKTDPDGVRTVYYYDVGGRLTYTVDGDGDITSRGYDRSGRLSQTGVYDQAV